MIARTFTIKPCSSLAIPKQQFLWYNSISAYCCGRCFLESRLMTLLRPEILACRYLPKSSVSKRKRLGQALPDTHTPRRVMTQRRLYGLGLSIVAVVLVLTGCMENHEGTPGPIYGTVALPVSGQTTTIRPTTTVPATRYTTPVQTRTTTTQQAAPTRTCTPYGTLQRNSEAEAADGSNMSLTGQVHCLLSTDTVVLAYENGKEYYKVAEFPTSSASSRTFNHSFNTTILPINGGDFVGTKFWLVVSDGITTVFAAQYTIPCSTSSTVC